MQENISSQTALAASALVKSYGRTRAALAGVSLEVKAGEVVLLAGPNGSGKSTLLKILAGLAAPSAGQAWIAGRPAGSLGARARLGYLPEQPAWHPFLTARETLAHCAALSGVVKKEARLRMDLAIAEAALTPQADARVGTFSRGMLQRLGLAQAALHAPAVLLLDEPLGGLDPAAAEQFTRWLARQKMRGACALVATHQLEELQAAADRIVVLAGGRVRLEAAVPTLCTGQPLAQAVRRALREREKAA